MLKGKRKSKVKIAPEVLQTLPKHLQNPRRKLSALRQVEREENGYVDPRQELFLSKWLDPQSPTFSNAYESAIASGYTHSYASKITNLNTEWLSEAVKDNDILSKAVDNLNAFIEQNQYPKIKWQATEFALETLGKQKFSKKSEQDVHHTFERIERIEMIVPSPLNAQNEPVRVVSAQNVESIATPIQEPTEVNKE